MCVCVCVNKIFEQTRVVCHGLSRQCTLYLWTHQCPKGLILKTEIVREKSSKNEMNPSKK